MSASPRLQALDADGGIARRFLIGAVQKAYLAFKEGRLEMSPTAWVRLLRLHYQELTAAPGVFQGLPSPIPVMPVAPAATSSDSLIDQIVLNKWLANASRLQFSSQEHPLVSVLVVLHNRAELTLRCLRALRTTALPLEIVLVDNQSTDDTARLLDRLDGVLILRNTTNLGFLAAVNEGVKHLRGDFLLLLNSDAEVLPGSLEAAVATLASSEGVGAVVGKLVHLNGRLQEAGSIIWQDGACLGYGRGDNPLDAAYMFRRPVDFGSGAFLLTRRLTFLAAGAFDERFRPAYYEDADYCLRLWRSGRQVIYEPRAVVLHVGSASAVSSSEVVERLAEHRKLFAAKHSVWLRSHGRPPGTSPLLARSRVSGGRRLLMIEDCVPHEKLGAGYPRTRGMIEAALALGHQVTLYPMLEPNEPWEEAYSDVPREVELMLGYGHPGLSGFLADRLPTYDVIIVSRPHNMREVGRVLSHLTPSSRPALLYDAEALFTLREVGRRRLAGLPASTEEVNRMVGEETALARDCDVILTVSFPEAARFTEAGFSNVEILGNSVVPDPTGRSFADRSGLFFAGSMVDDAGPNVDSVVWFVRHVLPLLRLRLGSDIRLTVAGRHASPRFSALLGPAVVALGVVDDLRPHYDRHRIFVAPTRFGAGIPIKVLHAAAAGLPVVGTSLVREQLHWQHDEDLLVADDANQFAEECRRLYTQADLWMRVRDAALARVERECAPELFRGVLGRAVETACARAGKSATARREA